MKGRAIISREDRIKTRQQLGKLRDLLISQNLKTRYERALRRFFDFEGVRGQAFSSSTLDLDEGVATFIETLWQEGEPQHWGEDAINAFTKLVPSLKGSFSVSWALVTAWQRNELAQQSLPIGFENSESLLWTGSALG